MTERLHLPDLLDGITLEATESALTGIYLGYRPGSAAVKHPLLRETERQLREYFAGERREFDVPMELHGSPFQIQVWEALGRIPYGQTRSYRDIAIAVERPRGFQAIGQANTRNPIPIIVPCHRVINADGSMGGYGGGPERKRRLLALEQKFANLLAMEAGQC
jgi:methylated-DNA-[protein]-cysteine S-methyltransferase